ncbi:MAG: MaoC family dehydratase N-terminal domain-containing protein [Chloroflexi bacterium]|nr:MaoC family dehydratase N-terminal domain-containing protein [Chloroflexota bacterium]
MEKDNLEFNREVLGKVYHRATYTVTKDLILGFSLSVGETNPLFTDEEAAARGPYGGLIAPPALVASFLRAEEPEDLDLKFDGTLFMAGQWVEPLAPIRAGDLLTCTARVTDVYKKTGRSGEMVFVVVEHTFVNQMGETVARAGRSSVRRR